jgi:hypothetical protein
LLAGFFVFSGSYDVVVTFPDMHKIPFLAVQAGDPGPGWAGGDAGQTGRSLVMPMGSTLNKK